MIGIKNLTNIHTLNLEKNNKITDEGVKNMTRYVCFKFMLIIVKITDEGIKI